MPDGQSALGGRPTGSRHSAGARRAVGTRRAPDRQSALPCVPHKTDFYHTVQICKKLTNPNKVVQIPGELANSKKVAKSLARESYHHMITFSRGKTNVRKNTCQLVGQRKLSNPWPEKVVIKCKISCCSNFEFCWEVIIKCKMSCCSNFELCWGIIIKCKMSCCSNSEFCWEIIIKCKMSCCSNFEFSWERAHALEALAHVYYTLVHVRRMSFFLFYSRSARTVQGEFDLVNCCKHHLNQNSRGAMSTCLACKNCSIISILVNAVLLPCTHRWHNLRI